MKNFNMNINFKPTFFRLLLIVLIVFTIFSFTGELKCDDGLIPISEYNYNEGLIPVEESSVRYNSSSWENNYHSRNVQESYLQYKNGQPLYQAYNVGLQETSQGYRYELGGGSSTININANDYTQDGRPVALEYAGVDVNGQTIYRYTYPTTTCSTQLGEIEPVRSEVINERFYEGGGWPKPPLDVSKTTLGDKIYNKAKIAIKNRFAKYNEPTWQRQERVEAYDRQMSKIRQMRRAEESQRYYEKCKRQFQYYKSIESSKKVRRFD
jgi:hypothetical protein